MEPRVCVAQLGRRQADAVHAHRGHRELPPRHGARSGHPRRKSARHLPVHGRRLRQQEPESGCRSDCRDAGQGSRRAGEAGALAQGRFHRRARPLADDAVLQGRRQQRRHAAGASAARLQRHGAVPQEFGRHRRESSSISAPTSRALFIPSTPTGRFREISAAPSFRRASSASSR